MRIGMELATTRLTSLERRLRDVGLYVRLGLVISDSDWDDVLRAVRQLLVRWKGK